MLNIHEKISGDVSDDFVPYSHEVIFAHLMKAHAYFGINVPQNEIEGVFKQIEDYPCVKSEWDIAQKASRSFSYIVLLAAALLAGVLLLILYGIRRRTDRS